MAKVKKKMGAPVKYDPDYHPASYIEIMERETTNCKADVCVEWSICGDTLWRWGKKYKDLSDAIKRGDKILEKRYAKLGMDITKGKIKNANATTYIWLTKNVLKWTDKIETTSKLQIDGIEFEDE